MSNTNTNLKNVTPLRKEFADRAEMISYLTHQFPDAAAIDDSISPTRGGRQAAEAQMAKIDVENYDQSRNYIEGAATRLAPYIRHGVISLAELRDYIFSRLGERKITKLIQELAWRDYFQRVYADIGRGIWHDREPYKTGFEAADYAGELPADLVAGQTGLHCVDSWRSELLKTGYLHNHARMWLAGYIIHWRRVKWQAGARWFLQHLIDGDPASNNLSWQWVASTFSHKPYFYNRENIEKFSDGQYCQECPLYKSTACVFEDSYAGLEKALFPHKPSTQQKSHAPKNKQRRNRKKWHQ